MTIDFERTFLDSSFFIYHIEDEPRFAPATAHYALNALAKHKTLLTSVVSVMEFCSKPYAINRYDLIERFRAFLHEFKIPTYEIDWVIADGAAQLRGKYKSLKGLDALQLSTARQHQCDAFLTNDKRLRQISELNVILISDLMDELTQG